MLLDSLHRDSFDIYRVEFGANRATTTSHINKPFNDAAVNIGLRRDGMLPGVAAYIAYGTNDADVALGFAAPSILAEQQAAGCWVHGGVQLRPIVIRKLSPCFIAR
jgi:hypothetical protein